MVSPNLLVKTLKSLEFIPESYSEDQFYYYNTKCEHGEMYIIYQREGCDFQLSFEMYLRIGNVEIENEEKEFSKAQMKFINSFIEKLSFDTDEDMRIQREVIENAFDPMVEDADHIFRIVQFK